MAENQTLLDDLMSIGSALVKTLLDQRHGLKTSAGECLDQLLTHSSLVTRKEFDTAFSMLAKARLTQDQLEERIEKIEAKLNLSRTSSRPKSMKAYLPSVKNSNRKKKKS